MDFQISDEWRDISEYGGRYSVSRYGAVRSNPRVGAGGRVLKQSTNSQGYKFVTLCMNGKCKVWKVHVLVATAFIGPRPPGMDICHYDDDKRNNNLSNLRYDTRSANALDSVRNGTHNKTNAKKTHCKRGHEFTENNTFWHEGRRSCRTCRNRAQAAYEKRKRDGHKMVSPVQ